MSIGIKHRDCWHYKLSKALQATIIVRYTYVLPNMELYGYQTIVTPRIGELESALASLKEVKKYTVLSRAQGSADVITWASQSSIMENILKTNCVFIGPTVVRDGIENWHIVAPTQDSLQAAIASIEPYAEIAYIRNAKEMDFEAGEARLTERQSEALAIALAMGYYDTPRRASAENVASKLGVSPSTAVEHLRKAEKKVLERYVHPY